MRYDRQKGAYQVDPWSVDQTDPVWWRRDLRLQHDEVIKWKHFPRYWPFARGIHRWPVDSPNKGQWSGVWCFLWSAPGQTFEQTVETPVIYDIMTSLYWINQGSVLIHIYMARLIIRFQEVLKLWEAEPNCMLYKNMEMIVTLEIATYVGGGSVIRCTFRKLSLVFYIHLLLSLKTQNDLYMVYTVVSTPSLFYSLNVWPSKQLFEVWC